MLFEHLRLAFHPRGNELPGAPHPSLTLSNPPVPLRVPSLGLPLAVSISLAFSVNKMRDENNLVKRLECCETMGGATNICSDKTGTLTQNLMSVQRLYIQDKTLERASLKKKDISYDLNSIFCQAVCFNSTANPKRTENAWVQNGNKTECALLELAYELGTDYEQFRYPALPPPRCRLEGVVGRGVVYFGSLPFVDHAVSRLQPLQKRDSVRKAEILSL